MVGHKICLYGEIWLIIPKLSVLPLLIWSTDLEIEGSLKLVWVFGVAKFQKILVFGVILKSLHYS